MHASDTKVLCCALGFVTCDWMNFMSKSITLKYTY